MFDWVTSRKWQPESKDILAVLRVPDVSLPDLKKFPMGIDSAHIDVMLSSTFEVATGEWTKSILRENMGVLTNWGSGSVSSPSMSLETEFQDAYIALTESVIQRAKADVRPDYLALLTLSVWRFLLVISQREFNVCRQRMLNSSSADISGFTGSSLSLNERIVELAKEESHLLFQVNETLFRIISKLENQVLRKIRKSVLGQSWPIDKKLLFNPLLQFPSIDLTSSFAQRYPAFVIEPGNRVSHLRDITGVLFDVFPEWLPDFVQLPVESGGIRQRKDQGILTNFAVLERLASSLFSDVELYSVSSSWLDSEINLRRLLGLLDEQVANRSGSWVALSAQEQWTPFLKGLRKAVIKSIKSRNLFQYMLVSSELNRIYASIHGSVNIVWLYQYLCGDLNKKDLARRLEKTNDNPVLLIKKIDEHKLRIDDLSAAEKQQRVLEQFCHAVVFRRDLKYAVWYYRVMDKVRLLETKEDIELSASNKTLQYMTQADEESDKKPSIRAHTIIKADLRGSSAIIHKLIDNNLNPAAYFSLNFFNPINELIAEYGATKVFIEGDAIILALMEFDDSHSYQNSVARANQLSKRILQVIESQNASNRKHGLPELETGIGVVYCKSPPAYLYDGEQPIMISRGIHRADRLSSCHAGLRNGLFKTRGKGVEVVLPITDADSAKADDAEVQRYNVNGIELCEEAFIELRNEISMRKVRVQRKQENIVVHAGRFTDHQGHMRWIMVREAPVYYLINGTLAEEEVSGRHFYEIVVEEELIAKIRRKLGGKPRRMIRTKNAD